MHHHAVAHGVWQEGRAWESPRPRPDKSGTRPDRKALHGSSNAAGHALRPDRPAESSAVLALDELAVNGDLGHNEGMVSIENFATEELPENRIQRVKSGRRREAF
jgi:hypothetical protein